jgi:hypothetical protein
MSFIQIVEYETDRQDEMWAAGRDQMPEPGAQPWTRLDVAEDRDHKGRYYVLVEFPSYEAAMANNDKASTQEMAKLMADLCTSGPTYRNLDVIETAL